MLDISDVNMVLGLKQDDIYEGLNLWARTLQIIILLTSFQTLNIPDFNMNFW